MPQSGHPATTSLRPVLRVAARASSRGQAFVFLLPMVAVLAAAFLLVFDSGQAVSEKQRLVNAADAAALSAATWQSRALNFESYMSRAVIANEAAIAQSVSLRSWSAYMNRLLPGAAVLTRWIPLLNAATLVLQRIWDGFDRVLQPGLTAFEGLLSVVDHDLAGAQRFVHAVALIAVPDVVRGTLAANDPRFRLSDGGELLLARWAADWVRFTSLYGGAFRWRQADVLRRSSDGFSESRGVTFSPPLIGAALRFEKRGGTDLLDFETWRGIDTLSLHTRSGVLFGRMREQLPLAWGGAENGEFSAFRGLHGGSLRINPRGSRLATATLRRQRTYLGLPSLRDVSVAQRQSLEPPRLVVRAAVAGDELASARRVLGDPRVVDLAGRGHDVAPARGSSSFAMAAAEVRFIRWVPRGDGARELGSLYNPYWRPRLALPTAAERALAAAADGVANPVLDALP